MTYFNTFFDFLANNREKIIPIVSLIAAFSFVFFPKKFFHNDFSSVYKERLEKVYQPIYLMMFDDLYKDVNDIDVHQHLVKIKKIIDENYFLVGMELLNAVETYGTSVGKGGLHRDYIALCNAVCIPLDDLSRQIGLPVRTFSYKIRHKQVDGNSKVYAYYIYRIVFTLFWFTICYGIFWICLSLIAQNLIRFIAPN